MARDWKKSLRYDENTGDLYWINRDRSDFIDEPHYKTWISRFSGKIAGSKISYKNGKHKCILIGDGSKLVRAHRIIWEMRNGAIPPDKVIDHIDGNPHNNRIANLRLCTQSQNMFNQCRSNKNITGVKGVHFDAYTCKYRASIQAYGKTRKIGRYDTIEEARMARAEAEKELHGEYARLQ